MGYWPEPTPEKPQCEFWESAGECVWPDCRQWVVIDLEELLEGMPVWKRSCPIHKAETQRWNGLSRLGSFQPPKLDDWARASERRKLAVEEARRVAEEWQVVLQAERECLRGYDQD
jgi:hypothetical protein